MKYCLNSSLSFILSQEGRVLRLSERKISIFKSSATISTDSGFIFDNEDVGKYIDKHRCCNPKVGLTEDNINKAKQLLKKWGDTDED